MYLHVTFLYYSIPKKKEKKPTHYSDKQIRFRSANVCPLGRKCVAVKTIKNEA